MVARGAAADAGAMKRSVSVAVVLAVTAGLAATPAHATFPGRNGLLVFQRPVGKQIDLYTMASDGGGVRRLTRTATWEEKPEWSPDGQRLAVALSRPSGEPTEIATLDATGGNRRALTTFGSVSHAPTWSPDGRIAYFTLHGVPKPPSPDDPPPAELYSMTTDGTDQQRLTNDKTIQTDAEWSPDGSVIAYDQWRAVAGRPGVFDIGLSVMNRDGTNQRPILAVTKRRDIASQSWSPDGKRLVVELISGRPHGRDGGRQSDIAIVNADGTGLRPLTRTAANETEPVWSPDGTRIAFASDRHVRRGKHLDRNGPAFEIYTMNADGGGVRRITHNHVPDLYPDWQALPQG
jgi:Tol biopolymer transport system component